MRSHVTTGRTGKKLKILKQIETLDAPDELKQQFKDLVDKPRQKIVQAPAVPRKPDKGSALRYNKPVYDKIIDDLEIDDELKEKLKIVNHHLVINSLLTGPKYKGYNRMKMLKWEAFFVAPLTYYKAGINKKWIMMFLFTLWGPWDYYIDVFRKVVLKEEDFWW